MTTTNAVLAQSVSLMASGESAAIALSELERIQVECHDHLGHTDPCECAQWMEEARRTLTRQARSERPAH